MSESTAVAVGESRPAGMTRFDILDAGQARHLHWMADMYSKAEFMPPAYRDKPANTFVAMQFALQADLPIMTVLQRSYVVHGRIGLESQLCIAMLNKSGFTRGPISYEMRGSGDSASCTATAVDARNGQSYSATVDWQMVVAEGWANKQGSKWRTMPEIMFRYRSAMFLIRTTWPEVLMGVYSAEELKDMEVASEPRIAVAPPPAIKVDAVAASPVPTIATTTPVESTLAKRGPGRPKKEPVVTAGPLPPSQQGEQDRASLYESIRRHSATLGWRQHEFDEALFAANRRANVVECSNDELRRFNEILRTDVEKRASAAVDPKAAINAEFAAAAEIESRTPVATDADSLNAALNEIDGIRNALNMPFLAFTEGLERNYGKSNVAQLKPEQLYDCLDRMRRKLNNRDAKDTPLLVK